VDAVRQLLETVWEPAKHRAARELAELSELARAEGMNDGLKPWDWRYYGEKLRQRRFALDESEVKQYFQLENMIQAAFATANRLFGISFAPRPDIRAYHPDVNAYEVRDADGSVIGLYLQDNFARTGKRSGAWMSFLRMQSNLDGPVLPIVLNNNNVAKSDPTLLSYEDARTLFHEFGHGLHGLLSKVRYQAQSGTSVRHDFVEFPSQVFEHWVLVPENLRTYARHARTGEPMPDGMMKSLLAARTFNQGILTVEYTASALLDLAFHTRTTDDIDDPVAFEVEELKRMGLPDGVGVRHRPPHFLHLFYGDGYAAGYYAYLWAEVLDADGFAAFEEKGDPFDPDLAARLRTIYSSGDMRDPMELYAEFRGRLPRVEALLKKRGLLDA
jgi:peptidyl-dipeptidase Dcp